MKSSTLILLFTFACIYASAQTIGRDVLSSNGNSGSGGGFQMSYTVGEPVIFTQIQSGNVLTQGFQQPDIKCDAASGTLMPNALDVDDCIEPGIANEVELSAVSNGDEVIPEGYSIIYILSRDSARVITDISENPAFNVNAPGRYRIHTLVYNANPNDPDFLDLSNVVANQTTIGVLLERIVETPLCASLDEEGALFNVLPCDCNVSTGTLIADPLPVDACLDPDEDDQLTLSAQTNGDEVIPNGYTHVFYLTVESGGGQIILEQGDAPSFEVETTGNYHIYSLIFFPVENDSNSLDISFLELGVTSWQDFVDRVNSQEVCLSIDTEGVSFTVVECISCDAEAGTLSLLPLSDEDCIDPVAQNSLTVTATPNGDDVIPNGYTVSYLLASGTNDILVSIAAEPQFTVSSVGAYNIFPIVYTSSPGDTNFLDLGRFVPGTTQISNIRDFITQNAICADVAENGTPFQISLCPCEAEITGITPLPLEEECLDENTSVISLEAQVSASIPTGYAELYVLTVSGTTSILQTNTEPRFDIADPGTYTIFGLVYDPSNFDPGFIVPDQTSIAEILSNISTVPVCLDFTETGAEFIIEECPEEVVNCDNLEIPTIFTPGGNGFNDTWEIRNFSGQASIKVFDRWGALMYDGPFPWNGSKDNDNTDIVPRGTYYFVLELQGTDETCKGAVTVIPDNP